MRDWITIAAAAAGAAATMYYFDPDMGERRRQRLARRIGVAEAERQDRTSLDDAELRDRIQSRLDRLVSHPRALDVQVEGGGVRLSGDILAKELDGLLLQVRDMAGVKRVINAMSAHDNPHAMVADSG
ncbi:MAG: BON domain-containing protein [Burkholderiales bacterium]|nr:BON domain-containing protein [Burkholderiales bacterium]